MPAIKVLQFICPTGFYGAERWILALTNNLDREIVHSELALVREPWQEQNELGIHFNGVVHEILAQGRFSVSVIFELRKLLKENEIDIIHTHGYKSDILGLIAARTSGVICLSTPHGFGEVQDMGLMRRMYHYAGLFCLRRFDSVAPLSHELYKEVEAAGIAESKLTYIANGVDMSVSDSSPTQLTESELPNIHHNAGERPFTIGYIGQMIKRKRVFDLLDVFDQVRGTGRDVQFVLVGDGDDLTELKHHASDLESQDRIRFLGFQKNGPDFIKDFDLFVLASSQEGVPRALMEAMTGGTPVVAYDIPGVDQLITNGETGLLAPFGDKDALAQHWCSIIDDRSLATSMGNLAKEFIKQSYSGSRLADDYTGHFQELIKR